MLVKTYDPKGSLNALETIESLMLVDDEQVVDLAERILGEFWFDSDAM